jgi:hypothetical protein
MEAAKVRHGSAVRFVLEEDFMFARLERFPSAFQSKRPIERRDGRKW